MVPLSAYAYLKSTQNAMLAYNEKAADKEALAKLKTRELIWGKEMAHEV